jgi:hypothetical protein
MEIVVRMTAAGLPAIKMKTKILFTLGMIILLIGIISATAITIDVKPVFNIGEEISFNYTISSSIDEDLQYAAYVKCSSAPAPLLQVQNATILKNSPLSGNYIYMSSLKEDVPSQLCNAVVGIKGTESITVNKSFELKTIPYFSFTVHLCKNNNCDSPSSIFSAGEIIYFHYTSNAGKLLLEASLTYPDGTIEKLNLPNSITAKQIGTYTLETTASKENYSSSTQKIQFGVIDKELETTGSSASNSQNQSPYLFIILSFSFILLIVGVVLFLIIKNKKKK